MAKEQGACNDPAAGRDGPPSSNNAKVKKPRVRLSIETLQDEYKKKGNKKPLETVMRAWKGIKELPPDDPNSLFVIGGIHGMPFRGAGWGNSSFWGGYCNHGNVLFPTWHRAYANRVEEALRTIPGCADVSLPFWDETSPGSLKNGIPWALTDKDFVLDGVSIPNPLRSFRLTRGIVDHLNPIPNADYSKPKDYETVRYPLSGLVGKADSEATKAHNAMYPDFDKNVDLLNKNIINWLTSEDSVPDNPTIRANLHKKYEDCLEAPNYTVFSNATSAAQWYDDKDELVTSLESPHNGMHLAIGGFDVPSAMEASAIPGANGDMGENDTAAFDPIFYFHHCFIDRLFWLWQIKHGCTKRLDIIPSYPGTNTVDDQGPTPGMVPNSWLTLDSPLNPFIKMDKTTYTSHDVIDIETQLGYTYGPVSLEVVVGSTKPMPVAGIAAPTTDATPKPAAPTTDTTPKRAVVVSGINRGAIPGSFLISAFAMIGGNRYHIGTEAVLSRWHVNGCANCQTHLEAKAIIAHHVLSELEPTHIDVEVHTRHALLTGGPRRESTGAVGHPTRRPFWTEVR